MKSSKSSISGYVSSSLRSPATPLLAAAEKAGDASIPAIEAILAEEREMADWLIKHILRPRSSFSCVQMLTA